MISYSRNGKKWHDLKQLSNINLSSGGYQPVSHLNPPPKNPPGKK